ncbi:MAG TPA: PEP-CTERM sorting domain-containing protein, partial [Gammaproteobacteria bacterium]|nr:PEP-CTERM sorting domain-containing protein [Gammaproteobacteria bacterium]
GGSTVFLDASSISGGVAFNDSLGGWILNVTTGLSKPLLGSAFQPSMDLNSVNVSSQSSGLLRIELTDTDFNLAGETASSAAIGGSTDGMVSYKTFIDASNTPFGEGALLNDVGSFGSGVFGFGSTRSLTAPAVYSLTAVVDILHSAPFQASSFNATLKVPEPSSVALLGAGLLALGFFAKRKRSAQ